MCDIESKEFKEKFEAEIERACSIDLDDWNFRVDMNGITNGIIEIRGEESC